MLQQQLGCCLNKQTRTSSVLHKIYHKLMLCPNLIYVDIMNGIIEL
jgi:hypothetical protein